MAEVNNRFPVMPENVPKDGNRFTRWLGRTLLRLMGWQFKGEFPNKKRLIVAAAPHTSNWDFILIMLGKMALGIHFSYLMKKEAFIWPFKGLFIRMGGVPIDRSQATDIVDQIAHWFASKDKMWVAMTPEGTRSKVNKWKTGFLRISEKAEVPVFMVSIDFPSKTFHLLKEWQTTGDHEKDADDIKNYINANFSGRHPEKQ